MFCFPAGVTSHLTLRAAHLTLGGGGGGGGSESTLMLTGNANLNFSMIASGKKKVLI